MNWLCSAVWEGTRKQMSSFLTSKQLKGTFCNHPLKILTQFSFTTRGHCFVSFSKTDLSILMRKGKKRHDLEMFMMTYYKYTARWYDWASPPYSQWDKRTYKGDHWDEKKKNISTGSHLRISSRHCLCVAKQAMAHILISTPVWNCFPLMSHTPWLGVATVRFWNNTTISRDVLAIMQKNIHIHTPHADSTTTYR